MDSDSKRARESFKKLSFKKKIEHIWFYYSKFIIIGGISAIILSVSLYQCTHRPKYDLEIMYLTKDAVTGENLVAMEEYFSQFVDDKNDDGVRNVSIALMSVDGEKSPEQAYVLYTKIMAELSGGTTMAYLVDDEYVQIFYNPSMEGVAESIINLNDNPFLKEKLAYTSENLYYVTKELFEREQDDAEKVLKHENAKKVAEEILK